MNLLRDYQQEIVSRVHEAWMHHRSVMVQMPTGTGKTHVLAEVVKGHELRATSGSAATSNELQATSRRELIPNGSLVARSSSLVTNKTILIVAHRIELIEQIKETLLKFKIESEKLKVESIQTISRRIDSLDLNPDLIVIDEAHHALAKTYKMLWKKWPEARFLGLTATPCRMNRSGFTDLFDTLVTSWSIAEFIEKGVLSAFDYASIYPDSEEQRLIDSLEKRGADGDYQVKEMDEVLNRRPSIERLYRSMMQFAEGKKGIVYAISIDHAQQIANYYKEQGVKAVAIDSRTPREERKLLVNDFKEGKIEVLVNVDIFSEGFDCPDVEFVQMARPTLSLSKYLQQVGRGLRKSEGKKSCMMIDNVGLYRIFGLPVVNRNWERMFRGEESGKGVRANSVVNETVCCTRQSMEQSEYETGVGLVVSHDELLSRLNEWKRTPGMETRTAKLKAWQEKETGLWGLKRGRYQTTGAEYVTVFDLKDGLAAVRFRGNACGIVDDIGTVIWRRESCISMRFTQNKFLVINLKGGEENYVDLYNLNTYSSKPEIKRYGKFELLKVGHKCYTRTERVYVSGVDFTGLIVTNKGGMLKLYESPEHSYCILDGDDKGYYRFHYLLADGSMVISDWNGDFYRIDKGGKKVYIGEKEISKAMLDKQVCMEMETNEKRKREEIYKEHLHAVPYQSGQKWGLKVGKRITVPPIYRSIRTPIGKFCAVEKNYSQWGVITIDGRLLIDTKYPDVTIEQNGTVWLTQVTGKKKRVKLD